MGNGVFVISLDFELAWGFHDLPEAIEPYRANLMGGREAVRRQLSLFAQYGVHATWATVGALACESKAQMLKTAPDITYPATGHNTRDFIAATVGEHEADSPEFFAASLIQKISQTPGQSVGSHTFTHFYGLDHSEPENALELELQAMKQVLPHTKAVVFPRNQVTREHILAAKRAGMTSYRGPQKNWFPLPVYKPRATAQKNPFYRLIRGLDCLFPLTGHYDYSRQSMAKGGICNIKASAFFQYYRGRLLVDTLKLRRIKAGMTRAAKRGTIYHLWWHPHNFGKNLEQNMNTLEELLRHYTALHEKYGMESLHMDELAEQAAEHKRAQAAHFEVVAVKDDQYLTPMTALFNAVLRQKYTPERMHARHWNNPRKNGLYAVIVNDGAKTVGASYFMMGDYTFNEQPLLGALGSDYMVDPAYRRRGISTLMTKAAGEALADLRTDFICGLPNLRSIQSLLANGWREVACFDYYFKLSAFMGRAKRAVKGENMEIREQSAKKYAKTIKESVYAGKLGLKRTPELLTWKLGQKSDVSRCFTVYQDKKPVFSCMVSQITKKVKFLSIKTQCIVDWHFYGKDLALNKKALAAALLAIRKTGSIILIWQPLERDVDAMLTLDFKFKNASRFGVGQTAHPFLVLPLTDRAKGIVDNPNNWKLRWIEADC